MGAISIPRTYMGQTLQEAEVKAGLREMQPDLHFDMGTCLNLWHPYQETRQNVYYRGRSVGAMDRGTLPENPIWTVRRDCLEVPWSEVRFGEIPLIRTQGVIAKCLKCSQQWEMSMRPIGNMFCPSLCENMGDSTDATRWAWADKQLDTVFVFRTTKDRIILVGWRHTFWRILYCKIPGITQRGLEERFRINLDEKPIDEIEIDADLERGFLDRSVAVGA